MKKYLMILVAVVCFGSANAECIFGGFSYKEDGKTVRRIELSNNCTCIISDYEEGDTWRGTYSIEGSTTPGGSATIIFNLRGSTYNGTIFFPMQGKWGISFDGTYFEASVK